MFNDFQGFSMILNFQWFDNFSNQWFEINELKKNNDSKSMIKKTMIWKKYQWIENDLKSSTLTFLDYFGIDGYGRFV